MKKIIPFISILIFLMFLGISVSLAQDPGPDPGGDPDAPIDGGIGLLIAAGAAYGYKKIRDQRKKSEEV